MDPAPANIQKIASKDAEISSFFDFCDKVHELSNCKEPTCEIKMFVKTLGVYLRDETKTEVDRRDFFISHCNYFRKVFKSMFNLSLDKEYTLELLDAIRKQEQQQ